MRFYYNCQHLCCFLLSECLAVCDVKPFYRWNAVFFILSTTKTISNRLEAVLVAHGNFVQLCFVGYPPSSSVNSSTTRRKRGHVLFFKRWAWKTLIVEVIEWSSMEWFLATKNSFKAMTPHHTCGLQDYANLLKQNKPKYANQFELYFFTEFCHVRHRCSYSICCWRD